jgi:cytochrome c
MVKPPRSMRLLRDAVTVAHALVWAAAICASAPAMASPELARQRNCMNCHQVERKVVGPALRDVARRYEGKADAVPLLARKIREGGAGAWGPVAMAANPQVSAEEAERLARWVLTLK